MKYGHVYIKQIYIYVRVWVRFKGTYSGIINVLKYEVNLGGCFLLEDANVQCAGLIASGGMLYNCCLHPDSRHM